jgi:TonB family protein
MRHFLILFASLSLLPAAARDPGKVYDLLKKGANLSATSADALERHVQSKAGDEEARVQLLSYYAGTHPDQDVGAIKSARLRHILYLIEHDPKDGFGLFQVATRVYAVNCQGDDLADSAGFSKVKDLWLEQVRQHPRDEDIRREAVDALRYCAAEEAETLLKDAGDQTGLGRLYGEAVLGVTGYVYRSNDPGGSDAALRDSSFAKRALQLLESSTDPELLPIAARVVLGEGATLWADGKLDWDYTPLGNALLEKARPLAPHDFRLMTAPTQLPQRGERPPATLTIGGNLQQKKLAQQPPPRYPSEARSAGIQGSVKLAALIGLDGSILDLKVLSGPAKLVDSSLAAVSQWRYSPTLLNGKPCFIITQIDVNYVLH